MNRETDVEVAVIGAGLAGLAAAAELQLRGHEVRVVDAAAQLGGVAQSEQRGGYIFERGPNTFRVPGAAIPFFERHGLLDAIQAAAPSSRKRFLLRGGTLEPVPESLAGFARSPLLSVRGKLRLLGEPFARRRRNDLVERPESVSEFMSRRFGAEVCEALVGPFLTGVYAGDERELGAEAVFPELVRAERTRTSITAGLLLDRNRARALAGSWSGRGGTAAIPATLAAALREPPRLGVRCVRVGLEGDTAQLELEGEGGGATIFRARSLVLATPAPKAADLLRDSLPDVASLLASVGYAPVVNLSLGIPAASTRRAVEGFGFLVPRGEDDSLLGCLFPSELFPARAPAGEVLLTAFAGGRRRPELVDWDENRLEEGILEALDRVLGFRVAPVVLGTTRWREAIPQPDRFHVRRIDALEEKLGEVPRLALAGGYLRGIAVSDALLSGERAAARISAALRSGGASGASYGK